MKKPLGEIAEVFNYNEKKKFIEILLIVATLLLVFKSNSIMIPTFTIFIIGSLMFIIWISMLEKLDGNIRKKKKGYISWCNRFFSAIVSFSFSSLVFAVYLEVSTFNGILNIVFLILSALIIYGFLGYILSMALYKEKKPSDN